MNPNSLLPDAAKRNAELQSAKASLADYIRYVNTEPLVGHIDANPFGVDTKLRHVLTPDAHGEVYPLIARDARSVEPNEARR